MGQAAGKTASKRIDGYREYDGDRRRGFLDRRDAGARCQDNVEVLADQVRREFVDTLAAPFGPTIIYCEIVGLATTELTQTLHEGRCPLAPRRGTCGAEKSDSDPLALLLCASGQRPKRQAT